MTKSIEIDNTKIDFKSVYKVVKIELNMVVFKKYDIDIPTVSLTDDKKSVIKLFDKEIGEESHICKPEVIAELAGKVGLIIKGFEVRIYGKKVKKVMLDKIIYLE